MAHRRGQFNSLSWLVLVRLKSLDSLDPVDSLLFGQMPHARVPSWYDMLQISEIGALTSWCSFTFHFHV